jgi:hypothetical protein
MTQLRTTHGYIPSMSEDAISSVRALEAAALEQDQHQLVTHHVIHGGVYLRTIHMASGLLITGALIKIATTLIISGDVSIFVNGGSPVRYEGYNVLPAGAGRKQAILANEDSDLTMLFGTDAVTVKEAEKQFTDEVSNMVSNKADGLNTVLVTGA